MDLRVRQNATVWAERGIPCFPIAVSDDGKNKRPLTARGHRDATLDTSELDTMFSKAKPREGEVLGIGLLLGPAGLLAVDVDCKADMNGHVATNGYLAAEHLGLLDLDTYRVDTPSSGAHIILRIPEGVHVGNNSPWADQGIDIRSGDGWVVAAGTRLPDGRAWSRADDTTFDRIADCPPEILARLQTTGTRTTPTGTINRHQFADNDIDRLDDTTFDAYLQLTDTHGAHTPTIKTDGQQVWLEVCRPGKTTGVSATIGRIGPGAINVFTSNWPGLRAGHYEVGPDGKIGTTTEVDAAYMAEWSARSTPDIRHANGHANGQNNTPLVLSDDDLIAASTLERADLTQYLGTRPEPERPQLLATATGQHLLYAGRLNEIHGEPGIGKTWILYAALADHLADGGNAAVLDYEDTAVGFWTRLTTLGVPEAVLADPTRVAYLTPHRGLGPCELAHLEAVIVELVANGHLLVGVDTIAPALASDGADENSNQDVTAWHQRVIRRILQTGATVLALDHVTKTTGERTRGARGAGAKLSVIDGVSYAVSSTQSFSQTQPGRLLLTVAKDRHGGIGGIGYRAADIHITPGENSLAIIFADADNAKDGHARPLAVMSKIIDFIESQELLEVSRHAILTCIDADRKTISRALDELESQGDLTLQTRGTTRRYRLNDTF